jgi:quercetin dioxygenase-like cupin family protein
VSAASASGLRLIPKGEPGAETPAGHWNMQAHLVDDRDALRVQYCEMEGGGGAEPHVHDHADQLLLVVEGSLSVGAGEGPRLTAGEGDAVYVPAGAAHATDPADERPVRYVVLTFPSP